MWKLRHRACSSQPVRIWHPREELLIPHNFSFDFLLKFFFTDLLKCFETQNFVQNGTIIFLRFTLYIVKRETQERLQWLAWNSQFWEDVAAPHKLSIWKKLLLPCLQIFESHSSVQLWDFQRDGRHCKALAQVLKKGALILGIAPHPCTCDLWRVR